MDLSKHDPQPKQVIARSRATYRLVEIMETERGCSFVMGLQRFDCATLDEARRKIDAVYAALKKNLPA